MRLRAARGRLLWKLLASQALLIAGAVLCVQIAVDLLAADAFMALMKKYDIETDEVESMFRQATRIATVQVGAAAVLIAFVVDYWWIRRLLRPLDSLTAGSARVAAGDYSPVEQRRGVPDELDRLVIAFNEMAASLAQLEAARKAMVVDVAHELRTPLTNLRGTIEALQDGLMQPTAKTLSGLHEELLRLVRLTEDLLRAARVGAEQAPLRRQPCDVRSLLDDTVQSFSAQSAQRAVAIEVVGDAVPPVLADPDQLRQVFGNLLHNALQYSDGAHGITISVLSRRRLVRVLVKNVGEPIPAEDLPWIFEPYYRVDKSRARERDRGGAGIGLAIVQSLVEAHGGKVGASSSAEATRVWVDLPVEGGGNGVPAE